MLTRSSIPVYPDDQAPLAMFGDSFMAPRSPHFGRATSYFHTARQEQGTRAAGFPDNILFIYADEKDEMKTDPDTGKPGRITETKEPTRLRSGMQVGLPVTQTTSGRKAKAPDIKNLTKSMERTNLSSEGSKYRSSRRAPEDLTPEGSPTVAQTWPTGTKHEEASKALNVEVSEAKPGPGSSGKAQQLPVLCGEVKTFWSYTDEIYERIIDGVAMLDEHGVFKWISKERDAELIKQVCTASP